MQIVEPGLILKVALRKKKTNGCSGIIHRVTKARPFLIRIKFLFFEM